jgi:hypothetical protein
MNRLLFGDNLNWLRDPKLFPDASVDLVYLDPPFNSNADYNVLFREASGEASQAQFHAFTDTWNWPCPVREGAAPAFGGLGPGFSHGAKPKPPPVAAGCGARARHTVHRNLPKRHVRIDAANFPAHTSTAHV